MKKIYLILGLIVGLILVGSVSAVNVTNCTALTNSTIYDLQNNVNANGTCFIMQNNSVTLDCHGFMLRGNSSGYGIITSNYNNVTIKNCTIQNYYSAVFLDMSDSDNIIYNNLSNNRFGVLGLTFYTLIQDNIANNNTGESGQAGPPSSGILVAGFNNTINNNSLQNNNTVGILLVGSNNTITSNNLQNNMNGIMVSPGDPNDPIETTNNILENNLIYNSNNGRGIYLENSNSNILDNNTIFNSTDGGIELSSSNNNNIINNIANENSDGIYLFNSSNNTIIGNIANSSTGSHGIWLDSSSNNTITNNTANLNNEGGITLDYSDNNTITNNTANSNNDCGIQLLKGGYARGSWNNILTENTANLNNGSGICLEDSSNNNEVITNTLLSNNGTGISLSSSSNNFIYNNYLNNTNNVYDNGTNSWNITLQTGTNIIGGDYIGGNFHAKPDGTGCSKNLWDTTGDRVANTGNCIIPGNSNIDYLPLTYNTALQINFANPTPSNGSSIRQNKTINITAIDLNLDTIQIFINNTLVKNCSTSPCSFIWQTANGSYSDGTYYINATANDTYSNINSTDIREIIVDNTAPIISAIANTSITSSGATITWTTDESANSTVIYSIYSNLTTSYATDASFVINHSISLSLSASTTHYYNVTSCDYASNCATNGTYNFTTSAAPTITGGGGGGGIRTISIVIGQTKELLRGSRVSFTYKGKSHTIKFISISKGIITLLVSSDSFYVFLESGETKEVDIDQDGVNDIEITVTKISSSKISLATKQIVEETCPDGIRNQGEEDIDCGGPCNPCEIEQIIEEIPVKEVEKVEEKKLEEEKLIKEIEEEKLQSNIGIIIAVAIIAVGLLVYTFIKRTKRRKHKKDD